jgi:hypothetical protein
MKNYLLGLFLIFAFASCSNTEQQSENASQDSIENKEMDDVDAMLKKDDSIYKAKEKELLGK